MSANRDENYENVRAYLLEGKLDSHDPFKELTDFQRELKQKANQKFQSLCRSRRLNKKGK